MTIILISISAMGYGQSIIQQLQKYEQLHNLHDVENVMSLYHDDIIFELKGIWIKTGKIEIKELEEWDKALNSILKFESFTIRGDSVFCKVIEKNDWFNAIGIDYLVHNPTVFVLSNGYIKRIIAYPSKEIGEKIRSQLTSIYSWSNLTNDSTIDDLIINGEFVYSNESAKKWITILDKWNKYRLEHSIEE